MQQVGDKLCSMWVSSAALTRLEAAGWLRSCMMRCSTWLHWSRPCARPEWKSSSLPEPCLPHHAPKGAPASAAGNCVLVQSRYEEPEGAWEIIKKGPERLESQFAAGYSMVLNLLYTRSLQEARAFIDRSFSTYMGEGLLSVCLLYLLWGVEGIQGFRWLSCSSCMGGGQAGPSLLLAVSTLCGRGCT